MAKKITDGQRIVTYAMNATAEQLQQAIETLKAIQANKFPVEKKSRKHRVKTNAQPDLPGVPEEEAAAKS